MQCSHCNALLEEDTVFCGNCGKQIAPQQAIGATIATKETGLGNDAVTFIKENDGRAQDRWLQGPPHYPRAQASSPTPLHTTPAPTGLRNTLDRYGRGKAGRMALIAAVILVIVTGGITVALLRSNVARQVTFADSANSQGRTDALHITINSLAAPPAGSQYDAWLVDDQSEHIVGLGTLVANGQTFSLDHAGNGTNLLGLGNRVEITLERGQVNSPTGKVMLVGIFPPLAFVHIRHLLFSFPTTPGKVGLLVGLQDQTQLLNAQAQVLRIVGASHNTLAMQCVAQSIVDISEGSQGSHYRPLAAGCALLNVNVVGDGFGLLGNGYLKFTADHASLAATQADSTDNIRTTAGHIEVAVTNIRDWVTTVDQDALNLLAHPGDTSKVQEIVTLADRANHGVDTNGDGQVDPVSGEAGATRAYFDGQVMATLPLVAGA